MSRILSHAAFAAGLLAIAWIAAGYVPGSPLAAALVLSIGGFYLLGAIELRRFGRATDGLHTLLADTGAAPPDLTAWLARLHPSLRSAVRLRVEGDRVGLPGPSLTPYLAGLLVLLGMLGTFLGMVATLKGTGAALDSASDVDAIRASLAAPVQGLGLAFGSSVAGVAASAMLGLMSALARLERQRAARLLDACCAGSLRVFSRNHQRDEALRLLHVQTDAMPTLVAQLQALAAQMGRQALEQQEQLLASQLRFQHSTEQAYTALAASVDASLQASLGESARVAAAALQPAVQATLQGLTGAAAAVQATLCREAAAAQATLCKEAATLQATLVQQAEAVHATLATDAAAVQATLSQQAVGVQATLLQQSAAVHHSLSREAASVQAALAQHAQDAVAGTVAGVERQAALLLQDIAATHAALAERSAAQDAERQQRAAAALQQAGERMVVQADAQARATVAELARLAEAAAEAPRAAAELVGQMRASLSDSLVRDTALLGERQRQAAQLDAAVGTLQAAATRFSGMVDTQAHHLQAAASQVHAGAAEVASLGEGFAAAVQLFSHASEQTTVQLQRIEAALGQSMARSDEQLAYYVAQAREIVDLTLGSQKQLVDDLQRLAPQAAAAHAA